LGSFWKHCMRKSRAAWMSFNDRCRLILRYDLLARLPLATVDGHH
jgi:hypothetical protein